MKKRILPLLISISLIGCSATNLGEQKETNNNSNKQDESHLFYNALVGNLMENIGQNNNAIIYYETILNTQYNKDYFNKLLALYRYKNDFVGATTLLKNTEEENIIKNHKKLMVSYYISKNNIKKSVETLTSDIEHIALESDVNSLSNLALYYKNNLNDTAFFFQESNILKDFYVVLKETNVSHYNAMNQIGLESNNEKTNENIFYTGIDNTMFTANRFLNNNNRKDLLALLNDEFISKEQAMLFTHFYIEKLFKDRDYNAVLNDLNFFKKKEPLTDNLKIIEIFTYIELFKNKDALYMIEKSKKILSKDYYYYSKSILNYRLGFKNAANRYMVNVKDSELIQHDLFVYVDIMGFNNIDFLKEEILKNNEILVQSTLIGYHFKKKNFAYIENKLKEFNELSINNNDYTLLFEKFTNLYNYEKNKVKALEYATNKYENKMSVNNANQKAYLLARINETGNADEALNIMSYHLDDVFKMNNYIDTLAYIYIQKAQPQKALDLYSENNMMYSKEQEIQENISKAYKDLGNTLEYKKHSSYAESLFMK